MLNGIAADGGLIDRAFAESEIIDLTILNSEQMPCWWPESPTYHTFRYVWFDDWRGAAFSRILSIEEHVGTHFDAPAHIIPPPGSGFPHAGPNGTITADKVPLTQCLGPAAVIDAQALAGKGAPGESPPITRKLIQDWEHTHGVLTPRDVVLLCTGWTDRFYKRFPEGKAFAYDAVMRKNAPGWPAPDADAMGHLVNRGVRTVGIDAGAMGCLPDDAPPHYVGLGAGMVFVERLTNLTQLPPRGAFFIFLPLKCEGGSGAPGRAIALKPRRTE